ncbi:MULTISPECIES: tail fiber assembly protein [unclassified Klebsiella]|uniref:tail fiber assembly protein n=1 Tax=Enterobacteriaceae TaxID=543 RepID=UPI0015DC730D|nr:MULTISPECIES: tail fiber assembly protein [unclassified Klebsiella]HAT3955500.1 tail fiber assembly protein [Kluyvera ascorbata]BBR57930.1 tail assembly protein [Klebsiella sp. WP4-W18-ESBL-05]BBS92820.1 tail assembly protein [Klebsiella sp. WP7-S18-CRE-02]BBS97849.1 tail assembly protein [Klebsiella sp. WP7-S18-CRE-03]BBT02916.1 tail assembly protein [Klebsiella sp. WP7-S18-ESBL-04]
MKPVFDENGLASAAGDIRCFYYDAITGEYKGWSDEHINIGVSLPGNSTDIDPGSERAGLVSVFNGTAWIPQPDHRGETVYSTADGRATVVGYIGDIKEGFTEIAPATQYDVWNGVDWVTDTDAKHAADVTAADAEKQARIDRANSYINSKQWPGKAAMGRLKESEKEQYNLWLDYLDALEAVDTSSAPAITWPVKPVE